MNSLLLSNAIVLGVFGVVFTLFGQNVPSRILGVCMTAVAAINAAVFAGVITLQC